MDGRAIYGRRDGNKQKCEEWITRTEIGAMFVEYISLDPGSPDKLRSRYWHSVFEITSSIIEATAPVIKHASPIIKP